MFSTIRIASALRWTLGVGGEFRPGAFWLETNKTDGDSRPFISQNKDRHSMCITASSIIDAVRQNPTHRSSNPICLLFFILLVHVKPTDCVAVDTHFQRQWHVKTRQVWVAGTQFRCVSATILPITLVWACIVPIELTATYLPFHSMKINKYDRLVRFCAISAWYVTYIGLPNEPIIFRAGLHQYRMTGSRQKVTNTIYDDDMCF